MQKLLLRVPLMVAGARLPAPTPQILRFFPTQGMDGFGVHLTPGYCFCPFCSGVIVFPPCPGLKWGGLEGEMKTVDWQMIREKTASSCSALKPSFHLRALQEPCVITPPKTPMQLRPSQTGD